MHIQNLVKFYQLVLKILSGIKILTSSKCHNSVAIWRKMMCNNPNPDLVYNFGEFLYQFVLKILSGNKLQMDRMTDNPNAV